MYVSLKIAAKIDSQTANAVAICEGINQSTEAI